MIGAKTLCESMQYTHKGSIVCHTGILGGIYSLENFDPIKDIPNGVYLCGFFSNYPTQEKVNELINYIDDKKIKPFIGKTFDFNNITLAITEQEQCKVNGKIVVKVD